MVADLPPRIGSVPPLVRSGHYAGVDGQVTLDVVTGRGRARFHFRLLCRDPNGDEYVTPGPKPKAVRMTGKRVGATIAANGTYEGPSESGFPGEQLTLWGMRGHFSSPTTFRGRVEFETATSPAPTPGATPPPSARPQCLGSTRFSLTREP